MMLRQPPIIGALLLPILLVTTTTTLCCRCLPSFVSVVVAAAGVTTTTSSATTMNRMQTTRRNSRSPNKIVRGVQQWWDERLNRATYLMRLERTVQDMNADIIASARTIGESVQKRRLLCLPLSDRFDPPMGNFAHNHVMFGDKMSLPSCFLQAIMVNHAPVPYLFTVRRIDGVTGPRVVYKDPASTTRSDNEEDGDEDDPGGSSVANTNDIVITPYRPCSKVDVNEAVGGPLDCRAPACYVFLPLWMMRLLGLRPYDIVEVEQVLDATTTTTGATTAAVASGSMAKLRPHRREFGEDLRHNPQAVLETELRHYSSLTRGSTIAMRYNGKVYWFDVEELRSSPRGEKVPMIKMQDCNVATDFLLSKEQMLDNMFKKKKKKNIQENQRRQ